MCVKSNKIPLQIDLCVQAEEFSVTPALPSEER